MKTWKLALLVSGLSAKTTPAERYHKHKAHRRVSFHLSSLSLLPRQYLLTSMLYIFKTAIHPEPVEYKEDVLELNFSLYSFFLKWPIHFFVCTTLLRFKMEKRQAWFSEDGHRLTDFLTMSSHQINHRMQIRLACFIANDGNHDNHDEKNNRLCF